MPSRPAAVSTECRTSSALAKNSPLSTRKTTRPGGDGSPGGGRRSAYCSGRARHPAQLGHVGPEDAVQEQQHRHDDPDEEPGQRVEDQHTEERRHRRRGSRGGRRCRRSGPAARCRCGRGGRGRLTSTSSITAAMTTAASVASGRSSNSDGQEQEGEHGDDRGHQSRHLAAGAGRAVDRSLRQAPVDDHAAAQTRPDVGRAEARSAPGWRRSRSPPWPHTSSPRRGPPRSRPA